MAIGRDFPEHVGRLAAMHLLGNGTGSLLRRKARRRQPADLVQCLRLLAPLVLALRVQRMLHDVQSRYESHATPPVTSTRFLHGTAQFLKALWWRNFALALLSLACGPPPFRIITRQRVQSSATDRCRPRLPPP